MNEIERVKEKIARISCGKHGNTDHKPCRVCYAIADEVLATEGVLVKSDDQSLPIPTFLEVSKTAASVDSETWAKMVAILDVITTRSRKAGFVRVVKEERKE